MPRFSTCLLATILLCAACSSGGDGEGVDTTTSTATNTSATTTSATTTSTLPAATSTSTPEVVPPESSGLSSNDEITGLWDSPAWGQMVLQVEGDQIRGSYSYDQGTLILRWREDGVLAGWWAEAPSREPDGDAGEVEFRFVYLSDGTLTLDGRWRYGTSGDWATDWQLNYVGGEAPSALVDRFADPSAFREHP